MIALDKKLKDSIAEKIDFAKSCCNSKFDRFEADYRKIAFREVLKYLLENDK